MKFRKSIVRPRIWAATASSLHVASPHASSRPARSRGFARRAATGRAAVRTPASKIKDFWLEAELRKFKILFLKSETSPRELAPTRSETRCFMYTNAAGHVLYDTGVCDIKTSIFVWVNRWISKRKTIVRSNGGQSS